MDQLIGQVLHDRYRIHSLLGRQTGRRTFLATDETSNQSVVVKLLLFMPDFNWDDLKLFEREVEVLKCLDHPAIPRYLDYFEVETEIGKGFALVQADLKARSLQQWMQSGRTFSEADLKTIATQLLEVLIYLHERQPAVVHRDIKPSNILLGDRSGNSLGRIYLVDFGSAQTAINDGTRTIVGTYGYMPPEQFGGQATPTSDLYALGATLVYLTTGEHPADLMGEDLQLDFSKITTSSFQLTQWLKRMVQLVPSKRFSSATASLEALNQPDVIEHLASSPAHPPIGHRITIDIDQQFDQLWIQIPFNHVSSSDRFSYFLYFLLSSLLIVSLILACTVSPWYFIYLLLICCAWECIDKIVSYMISIDRENVLIELRLLGRRLYTWRYQREDIYRIDFGCQPLPRLMDFTMHEEARPYQAILRIGTKSFIIQKNNEIEISWVAQAISEWLNLPITPLPGAKPNTNNGSLSTTDSQQ
jgi:serine/threonine protein kinase